MNPEHCLVQFGNVEEFNQAHPLYVSLKQVHHFHSEAKDEEEYSLNMHLPFHCDLHGFYDPIHLDQDFINLGIFPLPNCLDDTPEHVSPPSTKFLHLICEELAKFKLEQRTQTCSYFMLPLNPLPDDIFSHPNPH